MTLGSSAAFPELRCDSRSSVCCCGVVYRFGMIIFYRPIEVTAKFPIVGHPDQYFRTRSVKRILPGPMLQGGFNSTLP